MIFRDDGSKASRVEPFTVYKPQGSDDPRDLWKWMAAYEEKTGGEVLAIAHNGNLSNGRMFPIIESFTGRPIDREYAETRARWERIYEATQIKGDGEAHPLLSPNDEFASFERWDKGNLDLSELKKPDMLQYEYARSALKLGLKVEAQLGTNPYKFGLVGSTDAHTGLAAVEEDNFFGKTSSSEPGPDRATHPFIKTEKATIMGWETDRVRLCGGVGHREHAGGALRRDAAQGGLRHDGAPDDGALLRRVRLRGRRRPEPDAGRDRLPEGRADGRGPEPGARRQGADLPRRRAQGPDRRESRPHPGGQGLARQGGRGPGEGLRRGLVRPAPARSPGRASSRRSGNTVDVANATYTNTIGEPELITVWKDPDFDPSLRAFYYARVLEIPTPRWTAYDAKYFGIKLPPEVPMVQQERAYTSPIWYTP